MERTGRHQGRTWRKIGEKKREETQGRGATREHGGPAWKVLHILPIQRTDAIRVVIVKQYIEVG